MHRIERKLFTINDQISSLKEAERLAVEELAFHRHLHDDASRDAAVSDSPEDRQDARLSQADVTRMERHISHLRRLIGRLENQRTRLLDRLSD